MDDSAAGLVPDFDSALLPFFNSALQRIQNPQRRVTERIRFGIGQSLAALRFDLIEESLEDIDRRTVVAGIRIFQHCERGIDFGQEAAIGRWCLRRDLAEEFFTRKVLSQWLVD